LAQFGGGLATYTGETNLGLPFGKMNLNEVTFEKNSAIYGGGMFVYDNITTNLNNVDFIKNTAQEGGGLDVEFATANLANVRFIKNYAEVEGGGVQNWHSTVNLSNGFFEKNEAKVGGGVVNVTFRAYGYPAISTLRNVTFSKNSADYGGGFANLESGDRAISDIANSIFWKNSADIEGAQIYDPTESPDPLVTVNYSIVEGGYAGIGNLDEDPLFGGGVLRPQADSPAIDAGNNGLLLPDYTDLDGDGDTTELVPLDLDGNDRIINGVVDMGPYEFLSFGDEYNKIFSLAFASDGSGFG
jgi:hypothetical protein